MRSRLTHEFIHTANASPCANLFLEICVIPFLLVLAALQVHHQSVPPFADPTIQTEFAQSGRNVYAFSNFLSFKTEIAQVRVAALASNRKFQKAPPTDGRAGH